MISIIYLFIFYLLFFYYLFILMLDSFICNYFIYIEIREFLKIKEAVKYGDSLGLECHAGHGLNYQTAKKIAKISEIVELNIGHFLIGEAIFFGLAEVIKKMLKAIER